MVFGRKSPDEKGRLEGVNSMSGTEDLLASLNNSSWREADFLEKSSVVAPSEMLLKFYREIAPKLTLGQTGYTIIRDFSNIDVRAKKIAAALDANVYYREMFFRHIKGLSKREEVFSLEAAVVLLGMQKSRNLVVAFQMYRAITGAHPTWEGEDKLVFAPSEKISYAIDAEEEATSGRDPYPDMAYAAGLLFDYLKEIYVVKLAGPDGTNVDKPDFTFFDETYKHGLRAAKFARKISIMLPDFSFSKNIFAACLVHDIGKVILSILDPEYLAFNQLLKEKEVPRPLRIFAENDRYGTNHIALGALACRFFRVLRPCMKPVLYHHEPYLLRTVSKTWWQPAALVCLATNVANHWQKPENANDPVLKMWQGPELVGFPFDAKMVQAITNIVTNTK